MNQESPQRKSPRRPLFDYRSMGGYFVTPVVQGRLHLFGTVVDGVMVANDAGKMVLEWWAKLPSKFARVELGAFTVMPNHFHGVIILNGTLERDAPSLSDIMGWFKTMTTNAYIRGVKASGWRRFDGRLWQRSFHDHIIRRPGSFARITKYIEENPMRWTLDRENETRLGVDEFDRWLVEDAANEESDE
jgi:REP element-mobilizing transposase RayT